MRIGYATVSAEDQKLDLQHDALRAVGCARIFDEKVFAESARLSECDDLLDYARAGDVVVVWRLDRLARSLRELVSVVHLLGERGVGLRSLQESIDTTTSTGRLIFDVLATLAHFELKTIRERTRAGLIVARSGGDGSRARGLSAPIR